MEGIEVEKLAYLSVLFVTITGTYLISRRGNLGNVFRQAGVVNLNVYNIM